MADKPTVLPKWAEEDETDPTSGQPNVSEPPEAKKDSGFDRYDVPPRQWINWLARLTYRWILWAKEELERIAGSGFAGRGLSAEGNPAKLNTYRFSAEITGSTDDINSDFDGVYWADTSGIVVNIQPQSIDEGATETTLINRTSSTGSLVMNAATGVSIVWSFDESVSADLYSIKPGEIVVLVKVGANSYIAYAPNGISETVELGGDFDPNEEVKVLRMGDVVRVSSSSALSHTLDNSALSANTIPALYRPTLSGTSTPYATFTDSVNGAPVGDFINVRIRGDGLISIQYFDSGGTTTRTSTGGPISVSYPAHSS